MYGVSGRVGVLTLVIRLVSVELSLNFQVELSLEICHLFILECHFNVKYLKSEYLTGSLTLINLSYSFAFRVERIFGGCNKYFMKKEM